MRDRRRVLDEIEALIEPKDSWVKAAFYSDPKVSRIMDELYKRWEEKGRRGYPVDYATDDELRELYRAAKHYSKMPVWRAKALVEKRMEESG